MRFTRIVALLCSMLTLSGCHARYTAPEQPMPPNTVLLWEVMRELSARPGFAEALLAQLGGAEQADPRRGPALLTPALIDELRKRILGRDWKGLDRFPGWTMRAINPTVRVAGRVITKNSDGKSEGHSNTGSPASPLSDELVKRFLDLGPYAFDRSETVSLDTPSTLPPLITAALLTDLGEGVTRGDGPNDLAAEHAESQRLADVLNRLALNRIEGSSSFTVTMAAALFVPPKR